MRWGYFVIDSDLKADVIIENGGDTMNDATAVR